MVAGMHDGQHSQAMLERGVCELAHVFFHFYYSLDKQEAILFVSDINSYSK